MVEITQARRPLSRGTWIEIDKVNTDDYSGDVVPSRGGRGLKSSKVVIAADLILSSPLAGDVD